MQRAARSARPSSFPRRGARREYQRSPPGTSPRNTALFARCGFFSPTAPVLRRRRDTCGDINDERREYAFEFRRRMTRFSRTRGASAYAPRIRPLKSPIRRHAQLRRVTWQSLMIFPRSRCGVGRVLLPEIASFCDDALLATDADLHATILLHLKPPADMAAAGDDDAASLMRAGTAGFFRHHQQGSGSAYCQFFFCA